jgi:hypothetical protein
VLGEVVELGGVEVLGVVLLGEVSVVPVELLVPLIPVVPFDGVIPLLLPTVMWSVSCRLPEYDCAMRSAVCLSLLVGTVPARSMLLSVTVTATLAFARVGSLRSAFSTCAFS